MQASLIEFDDVLAPSIADVAHGKEMTGTNHFLKMGGSPVEVSDLSGSPAISGQSVAAHSAASNGMDQDFVTAEQAQQQFAQQGGQQQVLSQRQQQQSTAMVQEHGLLEPLQELQQQQNQLMLDTSCASIDPSSLPVCERVACLGQLLHQHGAAQGKANAKIRLLLATILAKQLKTRQLLAGFSAAQAAPSQQPQQQPEQVQQQQQPKHLQHQLQQAQQAQQQLQQQLTDSRSELAAARSELEAAQDELKQLKAAEAERAELQFLQDAEVQQLRASEQQAHAEVQGLQERLLEAEEALSRLSASLPGNRSRRQHSNIESAVADLDLAMAGCEVGAAGSPLAAGSAGAAATSAFANAADAVAAAAVAAAAGEVGLATPLPGARQQLTQHSSLMTPDQQNVVQLKGWLQQSQAALMEAQEDLLAREAQVKELQREQELLAVQLQARPQQESGEVEAAAAAEQLLLQQRELAEARAALQAAQQAAESASAHCDEASAGLDELRAEMDSLRRELLQAEAARAAAVAAVQERAQQDLQELIDAADVACAAAATATERAATAEEELIGARAAADSAAADVAALQQQLDQVQGQLQEQQAAAAAAAAVSSREPADVNAAADSPGVRAAESDSNVQHQKDRQGMTGLAGHTQKNSGPQTQQLQTKQQQQSAAEAEGSDGFELLKAVSEKQALQEELADTKQRLLLLLQLVRKAAAAASDGKQQLPAELAALLEEPAASAGGASHVAASSAGGAAATAVADADDEVGALLQLASGLEARYCRSEHLQQVVMRGKEMQFLLENALQQVHLMKAAAGVTSCACPSEQEYHQLGAAARAAAGESCSAAAAPAEVAAAPREAAGLGLGPEFSPAAADAGQPGAGDGGSSITVAEMCGEPLQYGMGQVSTGVDARMLTDGGAGSDPFDVLLQQQPGAAGGAGMYVGSSCSSDVLRVGATVGSGHGLLDEGLSYDGLESSWWNKSSVEPVTDLPDFLMKKS